jgi:hypothetical protein
MPNITDGAATARDGAFTKIDNAPQFTQFFSNVPEGFQQCITSEDIKFEHLIYRI